MPYGTQSLEITVPEERIVTVATPKQSSDPYSSTKFFEDIDTHRGDKSFTDFLQSDTLFIVNDGTRPTPTARLLVYLNEKYKIFEYDIQFMVATGTHRAPTEEELEFVFGPYLKEISNRLIIHNAKTSPCVHLGRTSRGTPVDINEEVLKAEKIVIITSVEPHYFAGFTGGRKSILPGVSGFDTIEQNHSNHFLPGAEVLELEENPIHNDMVEAVEMLNKDIFALNAVLDKNGEIDSVETGEIGQSFHNAARQAKELFAVSVKEKVDIVVTAAPYPMDVDLYQAQKALENGKRALKDDGIIILISRCREGVGDSTFLELLSSSTDPSEIVKKAREDYKLGYHKADKLAKLAERANIWGVTDLPPELVEKAHVKPFSNIQSAVDKALSLRPGKILFLPEGSVTVPRIS